MARNKAGPGATREQIRVLLKNGLTPRSIARALDLSSAAVYQHMKTLREAGELREPKSKARAS